MRNPCGRILRFRLKLVFGYQNSRHNPPWIFSCRMRLPAWSTRHVSIWSLVLVERHDYQTAWSLGASSSNPITLWGLVKGMRASFLYISCPGLSKVLLLNLLCWTRPSFGASCICIYIFPIRKRPVDFLSTISIMNLSSEISLFQSILASQNALETPSVIHVLHMQVG